MKLLIYSWNSYFQHDLYEICKEKKIDYDVFPWKFVDKNQDEKFEKWFEDSVNCSQYDAILSVNYWPMISKVAQKRSIKYIAWCYDNPLNVKNVELTLANPVNYVFFFDRIQFMKYKEAGFDTVWYLPLGVNSTRLKNLSISAAEHKKFDAEVSFIGNLYESKINDIFAPMNEYTRGYLNALMEAQSQIYGYYLLDEMLTEDLLIDINQQYREKKSDTKFKLSKEALNWAMASEITRRERILLLNLCGNRFDTRFYSYQNSDLVKNVKKCGGVDYISETPKIFACSKINLNPSLRIIQSGIPLRAFDIMGSGGFLLSNYQMELLELYENEKDMVIYESLEDAVEKADFYLKHESIRAQIAQNGRTKTLEKYSLQDRLKEIFSIVKI